MNQAPSTAIPASPALAFREAMARLDRMNGRIACIARMHLIGKLSIGQISRCLGTTVGHVQHDWRFARAWLAREIGLGGS